jgi:hypothetical protein
LVLVETVMDARIAELEAQIHRLRTDIDCLKSALSQLQLRKEVDSFGQVCLTLIVVTIVLFGDLWHHLGP